MARAGTPIHTQPYVRLWFARTQDPRDQSELNRIIQTELKHTHPKRYILRKIEPWNSLCMDVPEQHYTHWLLQWNTSNSPLLKFEASTATK